MSPASKAEQGQARCDWLYKQATGVLIGLSLFTHYTAFLFSLFASSNQNSTSKQYPTMDCPRNIVGSASQLFCRNKDSLEYKALVALSCLSHPQRVILAGFILNAADREVAAQYLLQETSGRGPATMYEFLADWIFLVTKGRAGLSYRP